MCDCNGGRASPPSGATPCNGTTTACPSSMVHALLQVKEITFAGNHPVEKDTLGNFGAPEWLRGRAAADNSPVCYTRNTPVSLSAKFDVTRAPSAAEMVQVRGRGTFGSATLEWTGSVTVSPGDTEVTVSGLSSAVHLPNEVACFDPAPISWEANPTATGWAGAGASSHLVYVVLGNPSGTPAYWTLLDISCRGAAGQSTEANVVTHAYAPFQSRSLTRKRDGQGLTYWNPTSTTCTNTQLLLASSDGSGQCGSWSEFLIDMLKCHGITAADKILVVRSLAAHSSGSEGFLVKNWNFIGSGSKPAPWTHVMGTECVNQPGVPGQRNPDPPPAFFNHFIVRYGGQFYDPSYGSAPVGTQLVWENGAIEGLFHGGLAGFPKASHTTTKLLEFWNLTTNTKI
jgi:hypothetical protein